MSHRPPSLRSSSSQRPRIVQWSTTPGLGGDVVVGDHVRAARRVVAGRVHDEVGGGVVGAVETLQGRAGQFGQGIGGHGRRRAAVVVRRQVQRHLVGEQPPEGGPVAVVLGVGEIGDDVGDGRAVEEFLQGVHGRSTTGRTSRLGCAGPWWTWLTATTTSSAPSVAIAAPVLVLRS